MKALCLTPIPEEKKSRFTELIEIKFSSKETVTPEDFDGVSVVFGNPDIRMLTKSVRWIQLDSAGANTYKNIDPSIVLTNCSGAYGTAIGEHMVACTLAMMKNLYRYHDLQKEREWRNLGSVPTVANMQVLSVGMGDIGSAYAMRMHALGARVSGVRRTAHEKPLYLEALYTMEEADRVLGDADIIALSLPETDETVHFMNEKRLRLCKKGAYLLNVGRGSCIEETALIEMMQEDYFKGVCLDVTEAEPLPEESPLWYMKNVYVTPHIAGRFNAEVTYDKVLDIFLTNLKHYLNNEPLEHVVDKTLGY